MSRGRVCDRCDAVMKVNHHDEDVDGESAAWLTLTAAGETFDFCTRACAVDLLTDPVFIEATDAHTEAIVALARSIRGDDEEDDRE